MTGMPRRPGRRHQLLGRRNWDFGPARQLFRIESKRLKLPAPFGRRIAEPLDADAAGQATFHCCFDKIRCEEGGRNVGSPRVSRPIEVVVLNCWVTETNDTRWASKSSTSLAKSAKRPRQAILLVPETKEPRTVPLCAGDGEGYLGKAVISLAVPGKAVGHHHHPLRLSIPLPHQNRARSKLGSLLVEASQTGGRCRSRLLRNRSIQHLLGFVIEIARAISLDLIGDDRKQQMPR